jgi:hypothetical protein
MCGMVALFSSRDPISEATLQRATRSLYHRGPDGQLDWMSPDRRIALGHYTRIRGGHPAVTFVWVVGACSNLPVALNGTAQIEKFPPIRT